MYIYVYVHMYMFIYMFCLAWQPTACISGFPVVAYLPRLA